jgi:hypothetical protein
LLPNEELAGDIGAALAVPLSVGMAISEIKARAAMNFFMTHLLISEHCPVSCNNSTASGHVHCGHHGDGALGLIG